MEKRVMIAEFETTQIADNIAATRFGEIESDLKFVIPGFIKLMNEIGVYGQEKHGENSFQARLERGLVERTPRLSREHIRHHIVTHAFDYYYRTKHDHFDTLEHQLAAIAFNAMMEYYFLMLEKEQENAPKV